MAGMFPRLRGEGQGGIELIEIKGNQPIAVMQDGSLWVPECNEDWDTLKKRDDINIIYSSTSQILESIRNGHFFEGLKEYLEKEGFQLFEEKDKGGVN